MELRQIKFFMAVAEERHFGRAAERMYITQPALSQHVRRLERELGAELFDRSARQVRLTPAGEAFLEVARRVSRQADTATVPAGRAEAGEAGGLGLGVHMPVAAPVLSVLLAHWSRMRPAVRPRLTSGRADELIDLVRRRELDVALVDGPVTDGSLSSAVVSEDQLVIVLPADHRLAREDSVTFDHLRGERFVTVARRSSTSLHDRFVELCGAAGLTPEITLEVDDPHLLPMAVAAGLGVGLVASVSVTGRALPGVVCRPVADDRATIPLVAVSARDAVSTQTQEFLHLVETLRHGSRFLPMTTVDVTDPPAGGSADVLAAPRALEPVG
jgi:DNA-binding transcriptional LysR family regulator